MPLTIFISSLALLVFVYSFIRVGRARSTYAVPAPATQGPDAFNRIFRAQQNTMEQLLLFLPSLWMFSHLVSELWGGLFGAIWVLARIWYVVAYSRNAKRHIPFIIAMLMMLVLLLGSLIASLFALAPFFAANF